MIYECFLKRHKTRLFLLATGSTKRKQIKKKKRFSPKIEKKEKSLVPELSGKKPRLRVLEERKSEERECTSLFKIVLRDVEILPSTLLTKCKAMQRKLKEKNINENQRRTLCIIITWHPQRIGSKIPQHSVDTKSMDAQVSLSTSSLYFQSSLDLLHYLIQCKYFVNSYKYSVNTMEIVASLRPIQVLLFGTF